VIVEEVAGRFHQQAGISKMFNPPSKSAGFLLHAIRNTIYESNIEVLHFQSVFADKVSAFLHTVARLFCIMPYLR